MKKIKRKKIISGNTYEFIVGRSKILTGLQKLPT